jgi:hypothetical protein
VVKQYFRFQAGRTDTPADRPLLRTVTENFRDSGFQFKQLILSLVVLRQFPGTESGRRQVSKTIPHSGELPPHVADNHGAR